MTADSQKGKGLEMTEFANTAELRRNQLEKLAAGFRMFAYFGFNEGVAGHITLRDPEFPDHFWVNPLGVHFSQISVSDLILVNHDGKGCARRQRCKCSCICYSF